MRNNFYESLEAIGISGQKTRINDNYTVTLSKANVGKLREKLGKLNPPIIKGENFENKNIIDDYKPVSKFDTFRSQYMDNLKKEVSPPVWQLKDLENPKNCV